MRTRLTTGAVLTAAVALLAGSAAASSVTIDQVSVTAGTATVTGAAAFDPAATGPVSVGGTPTTASAAPLGAFDAAGVDLQSASIRETATGLEFIWKVRSLPASPPPEVTRYTWSFGVGDKTFQLQAKRSNTASLTAIDDPQGHVTSAAAGAFQLRGNCAATYGGTPAPVSNCPHLAFLSGAFDSAKGEVRMTLPFGTAAAKEIVPGVTLVPVETATMSITAAFQAAVSNTMVSTYINGWDNYHVGRTVEAGVGFADADGAGEYVAATLDGTSYTASVPVPDQEDTVYVRACQAVTCSEPVSAALT